MITAKEVKEYAEKNNCSLMEAKSTLKRAGLIERINALSLHQISPEAENDLKKILIEIVDPKY